MVPFLLPYPTVHGTAPGVDTHAVHYWQPVSTSYEQAPSEDVSWHVREKQYYIAKGTLF